MPPQTNERIALPDIRYIRQKQLIGHILPFSAGTLWRKVKAGEFPQPIRLSQRVTCWRMTDIQEWLEQQARK